MTNAAPTPDALGYPGLRLVESTLITARGSLEILPLAGEPVGEAIVLGEPDESSTVDDLLIALGEATVPERHAVIALGSNASSAQMLVKLHGAAVSRVFPAVTATVRGLDVATSAHVARGGYLPAAPRFARNAHAAVVVQWLDDEQIDALDAAELDYDRVTLRVNDDIGLDLDDEAIAPRVVGVYVTRHGLLSLAGRSVGIATQRELIAKAVRRLHVAGALLDVRSPEQWIERMADDQSARDNVRGLFDALGLAEHQPRPGL